MAKSYGTNPVLFCPVCPFVAVLNQSLS